MRIHRAITSVAVLFALLSVASLHATPVNLSGYGNLQQILDTLTVGGPSSVNVQSDQLSDTVDTSWTIRGGSDGDALASIMIELAGYRHQNSFGIYDVADPTVTAELFGGSDHIGDRVILEISSDGSVVVNGGDTGIDFSSGKFGFYFDTPDGVFYSDTGLNADGVDHMVAYEGQGDTIYLPGIGFTNWDNTGYVLGLEDIYGGGDSDYNDMVVFIEGIRATPAPEPMTIVLVSSGTLAVGLYTRRRRRQLRGE